MSQSNLLQYSLLQKYSFHFPNLPSRLKCIICNSILKNSKVVVKCGCKVCEKCITDYLSSGPKPCPSNQPDCVDIILTMEDILQDNATNREIGNLTVDCPFESCTFSSTLKNMVEHIDKCEFREIECEKCKLKVKLKIKKEHNETLCQMRTVKCIHCHEQMTFDYLESVHLNCHKDHLCPMLFGVCPNHCHVKDRIKLRAHMNICPKRKLECPFHYLKCDINKMTNENLIKHLEKEIVSHSSSLVDTIKELKMKIESLTNELLNLRQINEELSNISEKSSESFLKLTKTVEDYKNKNVSLIQTNYTKEIFRNGSFIWKFTDFEIRRIEAESGGRVSVTSDPFYTSEFGYKMCLRVYPAGDGVGKGSYLSVFFAIMRGEYDDLLQWPFKQKVTLTIFDLESGTNHHSETFKPDTRSICYQKPTEECNIASGSPRFISLSQLSNNSSNYCKNDTIYIKISVDLTGILGF